MKNPTTTFFSLSLLFLPLLAAAADLVPTPWPHQFHSILFMNNTKGLLQVVDLWYDWPNGRNFNIIQNQLGKKLYDLEWDNGTSYYYTLDANKECKVYRDGFLCNVWEKVDFIWYYEDVATKRPVSWAFYTGMIGHVMTFEVGQVLDDPNWQAPVYCFEGAKQDDKVMLESPFQYRGLVREFLSIPMVV
ncbi:hypothetical protein Salat_2818900 [Sesamum alatum]|uniref:Uncharacterized protein n=1 Tax=Sesamum alatum TaxID=300844 RepID=A0AAE1XMG9_9LAMI|nr:hypothetical protein Salat_2818900 [Sesamum alatum]